MGAKARQGPHQAAQKSTKTGVSDFKTSWSKLVSVTSKIELLAIIPPVYVGPPRLLMLMAFLHQRISMNAPPDAGLTMFTPVLDALQYEKSQSSGTGRHTTWCVILTS